MSKMSQECIGNYSHKQPMRYRILRLKEILIPDDFNTKGLLSNQEVTSILKSQQTCQNNQILLRGGGCGQSTVTVTPQSIPKKTNLTNQLIFQSFVQKLELNLKNIINKAHLAKDENIKDEILINFQWFNAMKEHFNGLCQNATHVYDLIYLLLPGLLLSSVSLIRISGFLSLQLLETINDLARILFSYFMTNEDRFFQVEFKEKLLLLVADLETQLEIESNSNWIAGIEFEIKMIRAVIENSPSNSNEGKLLLTQFIGGLAKSILTMSPSSDLINSMIQGASFIYQAYKTKSLKKIYEIYYFFESLKWQIIESLKLLETRVKNIQQILNEAYSKYIENTSDWVLNFCWVKLLCFLILYRPYITREKLSFEQWQELISQKYIRQVSFDKNLCKIMFNKKHSTLLKYGIDNFQQFQTLIQKNLQNWTTKAIKSTDFKKLETQDYLNQLLLEKNHFQEFHQLQQMFGEYKRNSTDFKKDYMELLNFQGFIDQIQVQKIKNVNEIAQDLTKLTSNQLLISDSLNNQINFTLENLELIINSIQINNENETSLQQKYFDYVQRLKNFYDLQCMEKYQRIHKFSLLQIESLTSLSLKLDEFLQQKSIKSVEIDLKIHFENNQQFLGSMNDYINELNKLFLQFEELKSLKNKIILSFQMSDPQYALSKVIKNQIVSNQIDLQRRLLDEQYQAVQKTQENGLFQGLVQCNCFSQLTLKILNQIYRFQLGLQKILTFLQENLNTIYSYRKQSVSIQMKEDYYKQIFIFLSSILNHIPISSVVENFQPKKAQTEETEFNAPKLKKELDNLIQGFINFESIETTNNEVQLILFRLNLLKEELSYNQQDSSNQESIFIQTKKFQEDIGNIMNQIQQQTVEGEEKDQFQHPQSSQQQQQKQINLIQIVFNQIEVINKAKLRLEKIFQIIEQNLQLFKQAWIMQVTSQFKTLSFEDSINQLYKVVQRNYKQLEQDILNLWSSNSNKPIATQINLMEAQPLKNPFQILLQFYDDFSQQGRADLVPKESQIEQQIFDYFDDQNYKVRQCFVVKILLIQAAQLEPDAISFCQQNLLQVWVYEKDSRVRDLLKNREIMEIQKKLFSQDIKSLASKIQFELKEKFAQISDLEEKIRLEGDQKKKSTLQTQIQTQHKELEEYIEQMEEMSSKLDIDLAFLKEIKKDLTQIKQKIDKLQDAISYISDDIKKLRGKTYLELLLLRQKKVLEIKQYRDVNSIYIPLYVKKIDTKKENTKEEKVLLFDEQNGQLGEINNFITKSGEDVMLIKGYAGSGKSRQALKIEEILWEQKQRNQSIWIPIYVSLPTIKEPKFSLLDEALKSENYQFDDFQIKEFKEALISQNLSIILILDSYDEMKQHNIQQNLYKTNRFDELLRSTKTISKINISFKVIITTRIEILNSQSYQTWFYGQSLNSFKELELQGFNKEQCDDYLNRHVLLCIQKEVYELYEFVKQINQEVINLHEFFEIWLKLENLIIQQHSFQNSDQNYLLNENMANKIIKQILDSKVFKNISSEQQLNIFKKMISQWSAQKYQKLIEEAKIQNLLTTPFMMEIIVQVLPTLMTNYSEGNNYKQLFLNNFEALKEKESKMDKLVRQNLQKKMFLLGINYEHVQETNKKYDFQKLAMDQWEALKIIKFFEKFSMSQQIEEAQLKGVKEAKIVIQALKMNSLTLFDFYAGFIDYYHKRQIIKLKDQGINFSQDTLLLDLYNFSQSLAIDMIINQLTQVQYDPKGQLQFRHFKNKTNDENDWEEVYFNDFVATGEYKKLIRSCSLIKLKGSSHAFTHKTIQEFFVASYILSFLDDENLDQLFEDQSNHRSSKVSQEKIEQELFNNDNFNISFENYQGVLQLMKDKLIKKTDISQKLINIVKLTQNSVSFLRAASNSAKLLSFNNDYLGNQNLQNIKLSKTSIEGLSFYKTNLENSQFENVVMNSCNLNEANLNKVNWKNVICNELPMIQAGGLLTLSFSSDGKLLASGGKEKKITIWKIKTFKQHKVLEGHQGDINALAFSPDDSILASGSADKTVKLWNIQTGEQIKLFGHTDQVNSVAFSPFGLKLATGSNDKLVQIWEIQSGIQLNVLKGHSEEVNAVVYSPDGLLVASCSNDSSVRLWDSMTGQQLSILNGHNREVFSLQFTSDGQMLVSGGGCSEVIVWDIPLRKLQKYLNEANGTIRSVSLSSDGLMVAVGSTNRLIYLWDLAAGKQINIFQGHKNCVYKVAFSPDNSILASGGNDQAIQFWDIKARKQIITYEGHKDLIKQIQYTQDGLMLASISSDQQMFFWCTKTGKILHSLQIPQLRSFDFSPDGINFATGSEDLIGLWEIKTLKKHTTLKSSCQRIISLSYSPDGQNLISAGSTVIEIWDLKSSQQLKIIEAQQKEIMQVQYSPDGLLVVSAGFDKKLIIWDAKSWTCEEICGPPILTIAFSFDGKFFAGNSLKKIYLWNSNDRTELAQLEGHTSDVWKVAFSPNYQILASASLDSTIRVWDILNLTLLKILEGHTSMVLSVMFSPDGQQLASGSDSTIKLWDIIGDKNSAILDCNKVPSAAFSKESQIKGQIENDQIRLYKNGKTLCEIEISSQGLKGLKFVSQDVLMAFSGDYVNYKLFQIMENEENYDLKMIELTFDLQNICCQKLEEQKETHKRNQFSSIKNLDFLCSKVIGQNNPIEAKNAYIKDSSIFSESNCDLILLFIQKGAISEWNK